MLFYKFRRTAEDSYSKLAEITPLLSPLDIEYQQAYSGIYEDLSWISDDATVIAGFKDGRISGFGRPMVALGKPKTVKAQMERLYNISNNIYFVDYLEGGTVSVATKFLLQKGLVARPVYTQIIDLTKTEEELHADLRKSYKSLINQSQYSWFIDSPQSEDRSENRGWSIETFRRLHALVCGEKTRSGETWQIQKQMIKEKQAFVSGLSEKIGEFGSKLVSANLFCHNTDSCYYSVGKSLPDVNAHKSIWKAILHAKSLGIKTLEMGEQIFNSQQTHLGAGNYGGVEMECGIVFDSKLANISLFKSGFGGRCFTRFLIGE